MPHVSFDKISTGHYYTRNQLAKIWGYAGFEAIARGVVTPAGTNKIILFVTEEKRTSDEPYDDRLSDTILHWEGPNDHFGEDRMLSAQSTGDEIHLFYRREHKSPFRYEGRLAVGSCDRHTDRPSRFTLQIEK